MFRHEQHDLSLLILGSKHHPLRGDPHQGGGLQVGHQDDLFPGPGLGRVLLSKAGHYRSFLACQSDSKSHQLLRARDRLGLDDFGDAEVKSPKLLDRDLIGRRLNYLGRLPRLLSPRQCRGLDAREQGTKSPSRVPAKQIILVANLKPTTLMGIPSQGMVLAAEDDTGRIVLLTPEEPIPPGSKIR